MSEGGADIAQLRTLQFDGTMPAKAIRHMMHFGAVVLFGIAVDWVFYSRLAGLLTQHYISSEGYLAFLFPRVIVTILSLLLIGYYTNDDHKKSAIFMLGLALFVGSNLHAVYRFYRGDEI
ncbi:hypothetical protein ASE73_10060 [Sphingomonas sp. Leaf24]|nr:hypothetical protein ASE50_08110 [Sphingomonas sp. Leaf5]KQM87808.1 hypothetical protein ASE73_10060 [Sphingomonas sp. Leaf24]